MSGLSLGVSVYRGFLFYANIQKYLSFVYMHYVKDFQRTTRISKQWKIENSVWG